MVTTDTHQNQDLMVPSQVQDLQDQFHNQDQGQTSALDQPLASTLDQDLTSTLSALDPEKIGQGPVNAITVLTLLDKLVHMLDAVQENQHKMEVHQVEMENVVRGIQADMSKLSKNHSHTSNTVSKLLDKSRKLSVTMKEVREKMERQGVQVKKLEANHAHLINRNNFRVLIFQEENEIPSTVFLKDPPPFPRDDILEEGDELQEGELQNVHLSSDEEVGLDGDIDEDEEVWPQHLENMDHSRREKLKRSSLKKVDSLKKAFSRQNIEKKMTKIGTKIVSVEQREKIKQKTFGLKTRSTSDSQFQEVEEVDIPPSKPVGVEPDLAQEEVEPLSTEVEGAGPPSPEVEGLEPSSAEVNKSMLSEGVGDTYALSTTLPQEEEGVWRRCDLCLGRT
ncbi:LOW QUALITY PROTEIN: caveolae-associated protein 2-like [Lampetra planeri]